VSSEFKIARVRSGMTQEQAAGKLGVHPTTLNKYESGARFPSGKVLKKMSKLFKVPMDELITSTSESVSPQTNPSLEKELDMLKDEFLNLQRDYINVLKENSELKEHVSSLEGRTPVKTKAS